MACDGFPESPETVYWRRTLTGVSLAFAVVSSLAFALRCCACHIKSTKLGIDGILMGCAVLLMWADTASILLKAYNGIAVPEDLLPPCRQTRFLVGSWLVPKFWAASMACAKVSTILFLRRIVGLTKTVKVALLLVGLVVIGWATVLFFYTIFMCQPISYYWDKSTAGGWCIESYKLQSQNIATGFLAVATDVAIFLIPLPSVWQLQIERKRKVDLTLVLTCGFVVCVFSLLRVLQFLYFDTNHLSTSGNLESLWTILENDLSIFCGCAPHMFSLLKSLRRRNAKIVDHIDPRISGATIANRSDNALWPTVSGDKESESSSADENATARNSSEPDLVEKGLHTFNHGFWLGS